MMTNEARRLIRTATTSSNRIGRGRPRYQGRVHRRRRDHAPRAKRGGSYNGYARTPLEVTIIKWETNPCPRYRRLWPILLDAGATLPAQFVAQHPYLHMIAAAGGFRAYEKSHRQSFVELLAPEFPLLPREMVSHIVSFYAHTGYY